LCTSQNESLTITNSETISNVSPSNDYEIEPNIDANSIPEKRELRKKKAQNTENKTKQKQKQSNKRTKRTK
jgi:hypothetical protein